MSQIVVNFIRQISEPNPNYHNKEMIEKSNPGELASNTNEPKSETLSMPFSENTIIRDVLTQYLKKTNLSLDLSPENCSFLYNSKLLNMEHNLTKNLKNLRIRNGSKIRVIDQSCIIGGR